MFSRGTPSAQFGETMCFRSAKLVAFVLFAVTCLFPCRTVFAEEFFDDSQKETILAATHDFISTYRDVGVSGTFQKTSECYNVANEQGDYTRLLYCVAFDTAAEQVIPEIEQQNHWPSTPQYEKQTFATRVRSNFAQANVTNAYSQTQAMQAIAAVVGDLLSASVREAGRSDSSRTNGLSGRSEEKKETTQAAFDCQSSEVKKKAGLAIRDELLRQFGEAGLPMLAGPFGLLKTLVEAPNPQRDIMRHDLFKMLYRRYHQTKLTDITVCAAKSDAGGSMVVFAIRNPETPSEFGVAVTNFGVPGLTAKYDAEFLDEAGIN